MVEKAKYELIKKIRDVEIRKYPEMILAIVEGYEEDSGFNLLFNYISGHNIKENKIPMTAPVITSEKISMTAPVITKNNYMAFVLPSNYNKDKAPKPKNPDVKIKVQNKKIFAVIRFGGKTSTKIVDKQIEKLLNILKSENIKIISDPILMRYNSPFAPGFIRRNEVAVEIEKF